MRLPSRRLPALGMVAAVVCLMTVCLMIVCLAGGVSHGETASAAEKRLALVVGDGAYRADALPTAANDAGLVGEALAQDGFAVTAVANADAATLRKAVGVFADEVRDAGGKPRVVVYLSGQGVQYAGTNYVVPVDAVVARQAEVPEKAVALRDLLNVVEAMPAAGRLFVFDLAHPNAIAKGEPIPLAAGLRHMQPKAPGSVYAFNAAPGMLGRPDVPFYGIYARALAEALRTPGFNVQAALSRVRVRVAEITGGAVVPWDNGELETDPPFLPADGRAQTGQIATRSMSGLPVTTVYWAAVAEDSLAGYQTFLRAFPNDPLSARVRAMEAVRLEAATWAESCRADTPVAYWTYMLRYPRGPHYVDVRRRLAAIHAGLEPPMRFDPSDLGGLPIPSAEEVRISAQAAPTFEDSDWAPIPPPPDELLPPPSLEVYAELAPPPLVPAGALPIPAPLPSPVAGGVIGPIRQPALADVGSLTVEAKPTEGEGVAVDTSTDDGFLTRTKTKLDTGLRTIVQTDAAEEVVSWTTVGQADGDLTITQTGPVGELLSKQVAHRDADGDVSTILTNGSGKLVADVKADARGRILSVAFGTAGLADPSFALVPRGPRGAPPTAPASPAVVRPPATGATSSPPASAPAKPLPTPSVPRPSAPEPRAKSPSTSGALELRRESLDPPPKDEPPKDEMRATSPSALVTPAQGVALAPAPVNPLAPPAPVATAPAHETPVAATAEPKSPPPSEANAEPGQHLRRSPASALKARAAAERKRKPLVYMRGRRATRR